MMFKIVEILSHFGDWIAIKMPSENLNGIIQLENTYTYINDTIIYIGWDNYKSYYEGIII